jgi:hypothetical protein
MMMKPPEKFAEGAKEASPVNGRMFDRHECGTAHFTS